MEAVDVRGRFVWHQLLTRGVADARNFYAKVVGWKTQPWPLDPGYTVCHAGDVPTAGMMEFTPEVPAEAPPHWLPYIGTRDVDSIAAAAVRAGGSILKEPGDMKGAGRYAVLKDPQGAVFAIIDPEKARPESSGIPALGQFSWHELATSDHEAAFAFYSGLFGWDALQRMDMGDIGTYLIFGYNGEQKGGIYIKPPDMPGPPNWLPYCQVPSVDESVAVITGAGGKILMPPMEVPGGSRITVLMDPTGAAFALHSCGADTTVTEAKPAAKEKPKAKVKAKSKSKKKSRPKAKSVTRAKKVVRKKPAAKSKTKVKAKPKKKARPSRKKKVVRRKK